MERLILNHAFLVLFLTEWERASPRIAQAKKSVVGLSPDLCKPPLFELASGGRGGKGAVTTTTGSGIVLTTLCLPLNLFFDE